jgi:tetratricopeptide (TPR) repeat protein
LKEPGTGHLIAEEIDGLIGGAGAAGLSPERANHLRSCDVCRRMIAMHEEEHKRLQQLAGGPRNAPGAACPSPDEWASLAAGLVGANRREALMAHASGCDACGAVLHAVVADFSDEVNETESRALEALESAKPEWQRDVARRMSEVSRQGRIIRMKVTSWLAWAAAVIVAAGAGWVAWNQWMAPDPSRLIAKAYTQQRPFELRIPGAEHAAIRQERRAMGSFQRPPALLEAEARIARELEKSPDSVKWLALRARAEMLGWDTDTAIATLQRALEQKPGDPDLLADLGVAYALRAEAQNRDVDYGYAIDDLSRSLKARPNSPETVFNRAVVYERMYLYEDAGREWRRYLELDPAGAWHAEAQRRLTELEQKKKPARQP